jgi:putative membrane protein
LWEAGLFDPTLDLVLGENASGRGLIREFFGDLARGNAPPLGRLALAIGVFAAVLLVIRLLSMVWSVVRLDGFTLDRAGDDLRTEFGLFTRVMTTIPLHRIQTLTVREGPLHRLFGMASVRADSAGGQAAERGAAKRESLAPIVSGRALPGLLREVLPEIDIDRVTWMPVDPGGFRRKLRASLIFLTVVTLPLAGMLRWSAIFLFAALCVWAWVHARLYVKNLGWALVDHGVLFRSGWLWRRMTVARFTKIQAVTLSESPFDRRTRMAGIRVDTAGATETSHRIDIPYLARATAREIHALLSVQAAHTAFRW